MPCVCVTLPLLAISVLGSKWYCLFDWVCLWNVYAVLLTWLSSLVHRFQPNHERFACAGTLACRQFASSTRPRQIARPIASSCSCLCWRPVRLATVARVHPRATIAQAGSPPLTSRDSANILLLTTMDMSFTFPLMKLDTPYAKYKPHLDMVF
jgi:hypothetical protein